MATRLKSVKTRGAVAAHLFTMNCGIYMTKILPDGKRVECDLPIFARNDIFGARRVLLQTAARILVNGCSTEIMCGYVCGV